MKFYDFDINNFFPVFLIQFLNKFVNLLSIGKSGKMNPFKLKSETGTKKPRGPRVKRVKHRKVDGRPYRRYKDEDPDFKFCGKKSKQPIPKKFVRQMGETHSIL